MFDNVFVLCVSANPSSGPTIRVGGSGRGMPVRTHSDVGPFYEGEMLNLSCSVTGGKCWFAVLCLPCVTKPCLALPCFEVRGRVKPRGGGECGDVAIILRCFALPWSTGQARVEVSSASLSVHYKHKYVKMSFCFNTRSTFTNEPVCYTTAFVSAVSNVMSQCIPQYRQ